MRSRSISFLILFGIYLIADIYTYHGIKSLISDEKYLKIFKWAYLFTSLFFIYSFYRVFMVINTGSIFSNSSSNIHIGIVFTVIVGKFIFAALMLLQDGGRLAFGTFESIQNWMNPDNAVVENKNFLPDRRDFITKSAVVLAGIPFLGMLHGITLGKYNFKVNDLKLGFKNLPKAFEGFKILQISDIHAGSFDSRAAVEKGVRLINEQKPDMIVFTGDIVNVYHEELDPYIDIFAKLEAPFGKFAVLGNHDYYGVYRIDNESDKKKYWADFYKKFETMGFDLLRNENRFIEKDGERISLLGVENWGAGRWFPKEGDIDKALANSQNDDFHVLLSHDPSHWDEIILKHPQHIDLTLSGHTHGMQFGVNLPWFKWSPAKYRYPRWIGLYEEMNQYLYVNQGFGFLAFPGRVGIRPEISTFELNRVV